MGSVISIISRKGGSGKTTTAIHLATLYAQRDYAVSVLDFDNDGSALAWQRRSERLPFEVFPASKTEAAMRLSERKNGVVIIDTPPNNAQALGAAARASSRVVVVSRANALEEDRLAPSIENLLASGFDGDWGVLITQVRSRKLGDELAGNIATAGFKVLGQIPYRVEYERAFGYEPTRLVDYEIALGGWL